MRTIFAFDLDGTVTAEETLPLLAKELGLEEEMELLTRLTMEGHITFRQSFRLRFHILKSIPLPAIHDVMKSVRLDPDILSFIRERREDSRVVTGNLDLWIAPLMEKIGCPFFSSKSTRDEAGNIEIKEILDKGDAIKKMRGDTIRVVATGDGFNDIPMFEAADISIAYFGVHTPARRVVEAADYTASDAKELCRLLKKIESG